MIESKDMARKVLSGCGHSVPVVIPCISCVETLMATWELAMRDEITRNQRIADKDTNALLEQEVASLKKSTEKLQESNSRLGALVTRLEAENGSLNKSLQSSREEADAMRVQLQANEYARTLQLVSKKGAA